MRYLNLSLLGLILTLSALFPAFAKFQTASPGISKPSSSTDNAIVRWDGTSGSSIQNSTGATIDDSGNGTLNNLICSAATADRVAYFNGSKQLTSSSGVTSTELEYLDGVTSAIQTQVDGKIADPGTVVDNEIVRWDGTGGTAVQGSGVTISDTKNLTITPGAAAGHINLLTFANDSSTNPAISWGDTNEGLGFRAANGDTIMRIYGSGGNVGTAMIKTGLTFNDHAAKITTGGGIDTVDKTSDPCANTSTFPVGTIFRNSTSDYYCFCNASSADKQLHSPATDCF